MLLVDLVDKFFQSLTYWEKLLFFLENIFQIMFPPRLLGKMPLFSGVFSKSPKSFLEKLRGNRDRHSVATEHVSVAFSGRNTVWGVH
jgi:hypothetical protein